METETLRQHLLQFLKEYAQRQFKQDLQYNDCVRGVAGEAAKLEPHSVEQHRHGTLGLANDDQSRLTHVIWDLILERILVPSPSNPSSSQGWPFLSLTDYGMKVVTSADPVPYDPDGYLKRLSKVTPTVKTYLTESLSTFRTGNQLAAAVMLGAASEMLFLELCEAIPIAIKDANERQQFVVNVEKKKFIKDRIQIVIDWLTNKKPQLPSDWRKPEQIDLINNVANLIRNRRNEAGHPQDPPIVRSHPEMFAYLQMFSHFCEKMCELKEWLVSNPSSIT